MTGVIDYTTTNCGNHIGKNGGVDCVVERNGEFDNAICINMNT